MNPKLILCLALVLSGGWFGFTQRACAEEIATNAEPHYLDKSLSEWIRLARWTGGDLLRRGDVRALTAVPQIGTNANPWLFQWLRSDKPETARLGVEGFSLLGQSAKPAIPELLRMAHDWQTSTAWSNAISALATLRDTNGFSYAFTYLVPLATNQAVPAGVRAQTVNSIAKNGYNNLAVPVYIQCLQDTDWRVAKAAAEGLGRWPIKPKFAIPALAACLSSRTNGPEDVAVRGSAASSLVSFASLIYWPSSRSKFELDDLRQAMSTAVPALVKALDDENCGVARDAAVALGHATMEPDIVVPALVKSLDYPHPDNRAYNVRRAAIDALGDYGEAAQSAVPALRKIVRTDREGYVGPFAASALEKIIPQKR